MFYQADAYGRSGWSGVRAALARHGERIVGEATYKRGTKFTSVLRSQVEILKKANPDAVVCIGSYAACAAFARDAVDQGLRVPLANLSFVGSENLLKLLVEAHGDAEPYTRLLVNSLGRSELRGRVHPGGSRVSGIHATLRPQGTGGVGD